MYYMHTRHMHVCRYARWCGSDEHEYECARYTHALSRARVRARWLSLILYCYRRIWHSLRMARCHSSASSWLEQMKMYEHLLFDEPAGLLAFVFALAPSSAALLTRHDGRRHVG